MTYYQDRLAPKIITRFAMVKSYRGAFERVTVVPLRLSNSARSLWSRTSMSATSPDEPLENRKSVSTL